MSSIACRATFVREFLRTLRDIEAHDLNLATRYGLVLRAAWMAHEIGLPVGIKLDARQEEVPVFTIALPTGNVAWSVPSTNVAFEPKLSHDEKYERVRQYVGATETALAFLDGATSPSSSLSSALSASSSMSMLSGGAASLYPHDVTAAAAAASTTVLPAPSKTPASRAAPRQIP